jgi:hypothetical protein
MPVFSRQELEPPRNPRYGQPHMHYNRMGGTNWFNKAGFLARNYIRIDVPASGVDVGGGRGTGASLVAR